MLFPHQSDRPGFVRTWLSARFKKQMNQGHDEMKLFKMIEIATGKLAALARFGYPFKLTEEEQAKRAAEKCRRGESKRGRGEGNRDVR
jgi:hypothetical protein